MFGALANLFAERTKPGRPVSSDSASEYFGGRDETAAGVELTPALALTSTAVLAGVRNLAEDLAKLPLQVLRRDPADPRTQEVAEGHPVHRMLHSEPNPEMTAFELREMLQGSIPVYGYGCAEIERNRYGQPIRLWPLFSERVRLERLTSGALVFWVRQDGMEYALAPEQVLFVKGFSLYGLLGLSLMRLAKEAIGLTKAQEEYAARFFSNGAAVRGVLEHPAQVKDIERVRKSFNTVYTGLANSHRVAILEEGMKFNPIGISPEASQLIESRTFQIYEVCRILRMPPHKVQELSRSTFSNIEHQGMEYDRDTLLPWAIRTEQRMDMQLLMPSEKGRYFIKHKFSGLLRADIKAQGDFLQKMLDKGVYSINEARGYLGENPIGPEGDEHRVQVNTVPAGQEPDEREEGQEQ